MMEKQYFSLEPSESNKLTRIFQLAFGFVCLGVAIGWLYLIFTTIEANVAMGITIIFLVGFSYFQIRSGLGNTTRFIEINGTIISFRKNSFFPARHLDAAEIREIEIFPLNVVIRTQSGKSIIIRFGTTYADRIDPVKNGIELFARSNNITVDIKQELD